MPADPHDTDCQWMRRAIRLAMNGRGRVEPNPMVGCVITTPDGANVLGEGFHEQFGGPHAEPKALAACAAAGNSPAGATAYVTLEPCCHENKKTPPCVPRLIEAKVARLVVGCLDPNPDVNGRGVRLVRDAGIEVISGVLEPECKQLLASFIARTTLGRPYVTLKWAETADGRVAGSYGRPIRITNDAANRVVHGLRTRSDAILIGAGTALSDNPRLTVRGPRIRTPLRVVLDSRLRLPPWGRLATTALEVPVLVFYNPSRADPASSVALRGCGVELFPLESSGPLPLSSVLSELHRRTTTHVMVEPGPELASAWFEANLADRLWVFRAARHIDDATAPSAAKVPPDYVASDALVMGGAPLNKLTEYLNPRSPAFFAAERSADFCLAEASWTNA